MACLSTQNNEPAEAVDRIAAATRTRSVTTGAARLLQSLGFNTLMEFRLGNGRRADIAGLNRKGLLVMVEVKSSLADLRGDHKWTDYLAYCDLFYFAVDDDFPRHVLDAPDALPGETGLIVADIHGGAILREGPVRKLPAARRRAETLRFARHAAARLSRFVAGTDAP